MDTPTVYIETSVVSYLAARPSRHPETARKQALTHAWWARRERYALVTSSLVLEEAEQGDREYARRRLRLLKGIHSLQPGVHSERLASELRQGAGLPVRALNDARHIAIAAVDQVEYLVSWDRAHITNVALRLRMERVCSAYGYVLPLLCPPHLLP